jgi:class 3 adenylate cyclase
MATESELRREIADERRELTNAVASLREELGQTAERGKKLGVRVGAATGVAIATKTLLKLLQRRG